MEATIKRSDFLLLNIIQSLAEPNRFYKSFFSTPHGWLFPLLLLVGATLGTQYVYIDSLSLGALVEFSARDIIDEDRKAEHIANAALLSKDMILTSSLITTLLSFVKIFLIALILLLINQVTSTTQQRFGAWISLVVWTSLPTIFISLVSIINIISVANVGTLAPEMLAITNVAGLSGFAPGSTAFKLTISLDLIHLWSLALLTIALKGNGYSTPSAIAIASLPIVITFTSSAVLI